MTQPTYTHEQVMALVEAVRMVVQESVQKTEGPYSSRKNRCDHGRWGYDGCEECIVEYLQPHLAPFLTPSEKEE